MARKMLLLDIDAILNKQFNIDFKGYSPVEVDQFLDSVVRDYDSYEKMLSEVSDEAEHLKNENTALKSKVAELEAKVRRLEDNNSTINNQITSNLSQVDILRRIARLEQEVFNKMYELYDPIFAERDSDMTLEEFHGYLTDPFIPYCIEITSIGTFNWTPFIPAGIIVFLLALVLEICFVFKLKKRIVLPVVCGLFVLIPVIMFFNHIRTMTSVKKVTDGLYTMENYLCTDTKGLLESDAHTVSDLFDWILDRHFYGLKVDINEDNFAFGCAAFAANTPDGDHLFGRNFDYMETDSVLVHERQGSCRRHPPAQRR